jgi:hypothetical protein
MLEPYIYHFFSEKYHMQLNILQIRVIFGNNENFSIALLATFKPKVELLYRYFYFHV